MSACTCKGEDHAGPNVGTGRGVPEIDILEVGSMLHRVQLLISRVKPIFLSLEARSRNLHRLRPLMTAIIPSTPPSVYRNITPH